MTVDLDRRRELPNLERAFAGGNKFALAVAVHSCARRGKPLPAWAAHAFAEAFKNVYSGAGSWDAVLGLPYPAGAHAKRIAPRRDLMWEIYDRVENRQPGEPGIGDDLFRAIGQQRTPKVSKRRVSELYYEAKDIVERPLNIRNPEALEDPDAVVILDEGFLQRYQNLFDYPDPLLDDDDPVLP